MSRDRFLCAFVACVVLWGSPAVAEQPKLPPEAVKAIAAEDWPKAIKLLEPLAKDAANEEASFWAGMAHFGKGDADAAAGRFVRALRANPLNRTTALMLARCAAASGHTPFTRLPAYVAELEKAYPSDGDVLHCIGCGWMNNYLYKLHRAANIYARDKDVSLGRAVSYFRRADALGTTMHDNDRWLAFLLYRDGEYQEAADHARRAIQRGPVGYEVYLILAGALTRLGRHVEGDLAFAEAKRRAPGKAGVIDYERGKALCGAGRYNEAVEVFREVLDRAWAMFNVRHWIGGAAYGGNNHCLALWGFIESYKVDGRLDSVYYIGRCAYDLQRYDIAEKYFRKAIDAYIAKRKSQGAKNPQPPTEWAHFLGRAQWAQGNRDEALKNLESAFGRWPANAMFARWLYRAHIAKGDLHGAIDVCGRLGKTARYSEDAIQGVLGILEKWPRPRLADFLAKKKPHPVVAWEALAELYRGAGRFHCAAHFYAKARRTRGRFVRTQAAWTLVHTRRWDEAEAGFRDAIRYHKNKDYGRWGLGCVLTRKGKWAEASKTFSAITRESMLPGCDAGRLWAAIAVKDPAARKLADPYTLLGLMYGRRFGAGRGERILFIIPGSLLDGAQPRLRVDDVLVSVGEAPLGTTEQLVAFRKGKIPAEPTPALVRRGKRLFEVMLDYPAAVKKLPPAAAGASKEVRP